MKLSLFRAHHQEPKTAQAASGFAYVAGCRTCSSWMLSGSIRYLTFDNLLVLHMWKVVRHAGIGLCQVTYTTWQHSTTFHLCKSRGCLCSFRLLMMGDMSPKTCWASFKIRNNKIWYTVAFYWVFTVRIVLRCTDPRTSKLKETFMFWGSCTCGRFCLSAFPLWPYLCLNC
jgi:hypothetical protein